MEIKSHRHSTEVSGGETTSPLRVRWGGSDHSTVAHPCQGAGLLLFGGVGGGFGFESPMPWLLDADAYAVRSVASPWGHAPHARACSALSASEDLRVFLFGGFDGQADLNDLWCLSLVPSTSRCASNDNHALARFRAAPYERVALRNEHDLSRAALASAKLKLLAGCTNAFVGCSKNLRMVQPSELMPTSHK